MNMLPIDPDREVNLTSVSSVNFILMDIQTKEEVNSKVLVKHNV